MYAQRERRQTTAWISLSLILGLGLALSGLALGGLMGVLERPDIARAEEIQVTDPPPTMAAWSYEGNQNSAFLGYFWQPAGDVNGDGFADLVTGAYSYDTPDVNAGRAMVFYGSAPGFSGEPEWQSDGEMAGDSYGISAAGVGDVNGDGFDDILVGAQTYDLTDPVAENAGKAYLYYGASDGLSTAPAWTLTGTQAGEGLGARVGAAGDLNGDGYGDFAISATMYDHDEVDEGRVVVFYGSLDGPADTPDWTAEANQPNSQFGISVKSLGDVNGDGFDDLIIGADMYDAGENNEGAAFVWFGSAGGLGDPGTPANADWRAESNQADARYFAFFAGAAGDVNGDGFDDVVISAFEYDNPTFDEGAVFVWHGSASGLGDPGTPANADWLGQSDNWGYAYGTVTGHPADLNQDGYADLVVGCNLCNRYGAVLAYFGSETGLGDSGTLSNADWSVWAPNTDEYLETFYGWQSGGIGDVNGDGMQDLIISSRYYQAHVPIDDPSYREGKLWAYYVPSDCFARINDGFPVYHVIQDAIDASSAATDQIKVAGTCTEASDFNGVDQIAIIIKNLTLSGGYSPTDWTNPDTIAHPTILDGLGVSGGIAIDSTTAVVVEGFTITGADVGAYDGGAIAVSEGAATIRDCVLSNNLASTGGGLWFYHADVTLEDSVVSGNQATNGGGIYGNEASLILINTRVVNNTAAAYGGGINLDGAQGAFRQTLVQGNTALNGGGIAFTGGDNYFLYNTFITENTLADTTGKGAGMFVEWASPVMWHTTLAENTGGDGAGVYFGEDLNDPPVEMTGTLIAGQDIGLYLQSGTVVNLEDTLWATGDWLNGTEWVGAGTLNRGAVDLHGDPAFVGAASGDYHVLLSSAALDAGTLSDAVLDYDGDIRPSREGVDIGADELPDDPLAGLTIAVDSPVVLGQVVQFAANVTGGSGISYVWDFGDGATGTGQSPTHIYTAVGVYPVTVTATNTLSEVQAQTQVEVEVHLFLPITVH